MSINSLSKGERFVYDWQFDISGSFNKALAEAISRSENSNLYRLSLGFPEEVEAMIQFMRVDGWWDEVRNRGESRGGEYDRKM